MITNVLTEALSGALATAGIEPPEVIHLEQPARPEHGDWSSNVAMATAKKNGRNPRELAADLVATLTEFPPAHVTKVEIAGPGFVNFHLAPTWLHDTLTEVINQGEDGFARPPLAGGAVQTINIEFVSANPTGPLHAGGGRWAAYGDSLGNILERCGFEVHREYYLNDRGVQMGLFGASLRAAKAGEPIPEDGYQGDYIAEWAAEMPDGVDPAEWGYERCKQHLQSVLASMGVHFDTWFSEKSMVDSGAIAETLADLIDKGHVYESEGAQWLRTTDFGDDKDRPIVKSDGEYTYVLPDIAYHRDKFARGNDLLIDIWGADHHGYKARLQAGVQALGHDPDELEIILGQMVTLQRGGENVKLSKRSGDIVELAEIIDEVGPDIARFVFLLQSLDTRQTIDLDEIVAQSNSNPVFYLQYAHARIASMGRTAMEKGVTRAPFADVDLSVLTHERELEVLKQLADLPNVIERAARDRAPHFVSTWIRDLASAFHGFYPNCPVLKEGVDPALVQPRLWLVEGTRIGLAIGLGLLGVSTPEAM